MQVISTNIAQPTTFTWKGKQITTGIYKKPTDVPIYLGKEDVRGDEVSDRKVHGGEYKACYLFSANQYPYWHHLYPNLDWTFGMLGENLTVSDLDEKVLNIGDIYKLGSTLIQITIPREPCFKFAYKFGTDKVLQQFIDHGYSGTYVKVLKQGEVKKGDDFILDNKSKNSISVYQLFKLLYAEQKNKEHINLIMDNEVIPQRLKKRLKFFLKP